MSEVLAIVPGFKLGCMVSPRSIGSERLRMVGIRLTKFVAEVVQVVAHAGIAVDKSCSHSRVRSLFWIAMATEREPDAMNRLMVRALSIHAAWGG